MSTKTIAVETSVYARLAAEKTESESFTKVIDRLLSSAADLHTGRHIMGVIGRLHPLSEAEAAAMHAVVRENRETESWPAHDLR